MVVPFGSCRGRNVAHTAAFDDDARAFRLAFLLSD